MKRRFLFAALACAVLGALLCGCVPAASTAGETEDITPTMPVTGSWHSPAGSTLDFNEDGTYVDHTKKNRTGSYVYRAENSDFNLAQIFDAIEYVLCTDDDGDETITGAILQDVMIVYSAKDHAELYYVRDGRPEVDISALLGEWIDVYDAASTITLSDDGTMLAFDQTSEYTVAQTDCGTCITVKNEGGETSYAVATYEDYLFLLSCDAQSMYLLARESAAQS